MIEEEIQSDNAFLQKQYENYIVKVDASHILVKDEATAKIVSEKLAAGQDLPNWLKEYSTDPGSAANGGNLGFFERGKMVPVFEKAAFSLEIGNISKPVESQFGYHIIKVNDQKTIQDLINDGESQTAIDSYKDEIFQKYIEKNYSKTIESLKNNGDIEIYIN